jgi:hypothetical protein
MKPASKSASHQILVLRNNTLQHIIEQGPIGYSRIPCVPVSALCRANLIEDPESEGPTMMSQNKHGRLVVAADNI